MAGIFGVAQMADKARAGRAGKNGVYRYGDGSGQDRSILQFLGILAADFPKQPLTFLMMSN